MLTKSLCRKNYHGELAMAPDREIQAVALITVLFYAGIIIAALYAIIS